MSTDARPEHGGTDDGPTPRIDLSTNANPYGPSPAALAALQVDVGPYPDPSGSATIAAIADHHRIDPATVVLGAGATELIDRLVRVVGGPVLLGSVDFGEYAAAAARHRAPVLRPAQPDYLDAIADARLLFVSSPHNPTGGSIDPTVVAMIEERAAASGTTMVWDLAYAPMVATAPDVPADAVLLHAPNKAHGCTGIRAGWLQAPPALAAELRTAEVSWSLSTVAQAFLAATASDAADGWVARTCARLRRDGDALLAALQDQRVPARREDAPFVLVQLPDGCAARAVAARLRRDAGIRVRSTDSMGLPGHLRVAPPWVGAPLGPTDVATALRRAVAATTMAGDGSPVPPTEKAAPCDR